MPLAISRIGRIHLMNCRKYCLSLTVCFVLGQVTFLTTAWAEGTSTKDPQSPEKTASPVATVYTVHNSPVPARSPQKNRKKNMSISAQTHVAMSPGSPAPRTALTDPEKIPATPSEEVSKKWGIEVQSLRTTAGGYMLDFRYRVDDPEKAQQLLLPKMSPCLIDEATGAKFLVPRPPKVGSLRASGKPVVGKIYFVIFANPGSFIKEGNKVSVVIGDFKVEHLTVE